MEKTAKQKTKHIVNKKLRSHLNKLDENRNDLGAAVFRLRIANDNLEKHLSGTKK